MSQDMLRTPFGHPLIRSVFRLSCTCAVWFCTAVLFFPELSGAAPLAAETQRGGVQLTTGYSYRQDDFDWNIAGTPEGTDPNVFSELSWSDLQVHQFGLGIRIGGKQGVLLKGAFDYGWIVDGDNQDSDYLDDDRRNEFSRSNNQSDDGNTLDFSAGIGYGIALGRSVISLAPLIGYSYHRQELTMTDGNQTIPDLGAFSGLNSSYDASWKGPWVGLEFDVDLKKAVRWLPAVVLGLGVEHHWAEYDATADWNLRPDFMHPKSFQQKADGQGDRLFIGLRYRIGSRTDLGLIYEQQQWRAENGVDCLFLSNGQTVETRLNEVNWNSQAVHLQLSVNF